MQQCKTWDGIFRWGEGVVLLNIAAYLDRLRIRVFCMSITRRTFRHCTVRKFSRRFASAGLSILGYFCVHCRKRGRPKEEKVVRCPSPESRGQLVAVPLMATVGRNGGAFSSGTVALTLLFALLIFSSIIAADDHSGFQVSGGSPARNLAS